jgi:hypothetical protein
VEGDGQFRVVLAEEAEIGLHSIERQHAVTAARVDAEIAGVGAADARQERHGARRARPVVEEERLTDLRHPLLDARQLAQRASAADDLSARGVAQ